MNTTQASTKPIKLRVWRYSRRLESTCLGRSSIKTNDCGLCSPRMNASDCTTLGSCGSGSQRSTSTSSKYHLVIRKHGVQSAEFPKSIFRLRTPVTPENIYDGAGIEDGRAPAARSKDVHIPPSDACTDSTSYIRRMRKELPEPFSLR